MLPYASDGCVTVNRPEFAHPKAAMQVLAERRVVPILREMVRRV
jgi:hypothetical protein